MRRRANSQSRMTEESVARDCCACALHCTDGVGALRHCVDEGLLGRHRRAGGRRGGKGVGRSEIVAPKQRAARASCHRGLGGAEADLNCGAEGELSAQAAVLNMPPQSPNASEPGNRVGVLMCGASSAGRGNAPEAPELPRERGARCSRLIVGVVQQSPSRERPSCCGGGVK
jgi:hypothetical protein